MYLDAEEIESDTPELLEDLEKMALAQYRGEIAYVDAQIGALCELLERHGLYERTAIVFVADHGENFLDREPHLAFNHAGLHHEVTRLPLLIKPPGRANWASRFVPGTVPPTPSPFPPEQRCFQFPWPRTTASSSSLPGHTDRKISPFGPARSLFPPLSNGSDPIGS